MKSLILKTTTLFGALLLNLHLFAHNSAPMPVITLAGVEVKGTKLDSSLVTDLVIHELRKLNIYDVTNRRDAEYAAGQDGFSLQDCYSKQCMLRIGKLTESQKVMGGSIERFSDKIYLTFRLIDVSTGQVEKSFSMEFLNLEDRIAMMIEITLKKMHDLAYDEESFKKVTTIQTLENTLNNPNVNKLNLSGPRFGFGMMLGPDARDYRRPENQGGWGVEPIASHIGYQFEVSYLNQGNIQGLFEFIPLINAIEQGAFIPSLGIMHGIRSNKTGFEFAVGTNFSTVTRKLGYYHEGGRWVEGKNPEGTEKATLHRDGKLKIEGGLVLAVGKSFRSGNMNFPVNAYAVIRKDSPRIGLSLGFNTRK